MATSSISTGSAKGYGAVGRLLTDVSAGLDEADRVGVVGLNAPASRRCCGC